MRITICKSPSTKITSDDGDDLIPLSSQVQHFCTATLTLYLKEMPYWLKSMVMGRYKVSADQDADRHDICGNHSQFKKPQNSGGGVRTFLVFLPTGCMIQM